MTRYVVRRKADGKFYKKTRSWPYKDKAWVADICDAHVYRHRGHPRLSLYYKEGLYPPYRNGELRGERRAVAAQRFDEAYEVLEVRFIL